MNRLMYVSFLAVFCSLGTGVGLRHVEQTRQQAAQQRLTNLQQEHSQLQALFSEQDRVVDHVRKQLDLLRNAPPLFTLPDQTGSPDTTESVPEAPRASDTVSAPKEEPPDSPNPQAARRRSPAKRRAFTAEELAAFEQRRREHRVNNSQRVVGQLDERLEYFQQVPLTGLSAVHLESHEDLLHNLTHMRTSLSSVSDGMNREEYMRALRDASKAATAINQAMIREREILLYDLVHTAMQQDAPDIPAMVKQVRDIEAMTSQVNAIRGFRSP